MGRLLLPVGPIAAIALGGWLYFLPFVTANVLVAYKSNKAITTQQFRDPSPR